MERRGDSSFLDDPVNLSDLSFGNEFSEKVLAMHFGYGDGFSIDSPLYLENNPSISLFPGAESAEAFNHILFTDESEFPPDKPECTAIDDYLWDIPPETLPKSSPPSLPSSEHAEIQAQILSEPPVPGEDDVVEHDNK